MMALFVGQAGRGGSVLVKLGEIIRQRLKKWLADPPPPPLTIHVKINGEIKELPIIRAVGVCLEVQGRNYVRIVTEAQAQAERPFGVLGSSGQEIRNSSGKMATNLSLRGVDCASYYAG